MYARELIGDCRLRLHHDHCAEDELIVLLADALGELAVAEARYRDMHDREGRHSILTGRAWDRMRRAGDAARELLKEVGHERS